MKIISYVLLLLLPGLILLTSFRINAFDKEFYDKEFSEYGIYDRFDKNIVDENVDELISYLNGREELDTDFFNEKEKKHLQDVRKLIINATLLFYLKAVAVFLMVMYLIRLRRYRDIGKAFVIGGIITILLILTVGSIIYLDFDRFFLNFHLISFDNDYWLLNPDVDNLIALFPEGFFFDMAKRIIIYTSFLASGTILVGILLLIYGKKHGRYTKAI